MKIPHDIALVGFNNVATTALQSIEITTVSQNKQEMGRLGVKRLIDKIEKNRGYKKPYHIVLEPKLIIRKSCGFSRFFRAYCASGQEQRGVRYRTLQIPYI